MKSSVQSCVGNQFVRRRGWLALLSLVVCFAGCLRADVFYYLGYDGADDSFTVSVVYTNLQAESPADLEHLASLWKQRDEIIIHPFVMNFFGGQQAVLRIDAKQYKAIDLSRSENKELPVLASEIPLDSIAVQPGKFFMGPDKTLGYWHTIKVPGKSIDQLLVEANQFINRGLAEEIPKELKRRADGGAVGTGMNCGAECSTRSPLSGKTLSRTRSKAKVARRRNRPRRQITLNKPTKAFR